MHQKFMYLALKEARKAMWETHPNPMVGCVVVSQGEVIASGYHRQCGMPHAEQEALALLEGKAPGADVYVTLEPCCHHGKTPPCVDALIRAEVARVFVGIVDPDPRVSGSGIQNLREAGIEVYVGLLLEECRRLNAPFFKRVETGLPWVVVSDTFPSYSESFDVILGGFVHGIPDGRDVQATPEFLRSLVKDFGVTTLLVTHPDWADKFANQGLVDDVIHPLTNVPSSLSLSLGTGCYGKCVS